MPRVLVTADDGTVFWDERVTVTHFESDHFRKQLAERLGWAVDDAHAGVPATQTTPRRTRPSLAVLDRGEGPSRDDCLAAA